MKTSSAKQKGRKLQQTLRDKLLETFPELEKDDVKSTSMGAQGEDVQLSPAARKLIPCQFECKSRASIAVYKMYEQAATHGKDIPVLVIKENRKEPLVVLSLDDFLKIMRVYAQV